jgi:hypothetical protein
VFRHLLQLYQIAELLRLVPLISYYDFQWNQVFAEASIESSEEEDGDIFVVWRAVNLELKAVAGHASLAITEKARTDHDLLVALVPQLTHNLIEAWNWQLAFHKIERHDDYSHIGLASIIPSSQNRSFRDWSKIVALLWDGSSCSQSATYTWRRFLRSSGVRSIIRVAT